MLSNVEIKFLDKKVTLGYVLLRFTRLLVFQGKSVNWGLFYFSFAGKTQLKKECNKNWRNFLCFKYYQGNIFGTFSFLSYKYFKGYFKYY